MKIKCPACGQTYKIDDSMQGQWMKCADCSEEFQAYAMPKKDRSKIVKRVIRFSVIPLLLLIVLGVVVGKHQTEKRLQRRIRIAKSCVEDKLKKCFKYPESADYVYTTERQHPVYDNQFVFDGYVLAPNAFGVKSRYNFSACIDMGVYDKETHDYYYHYFILRHPDGTSEVVK